MPLVALGLRAPNIAHDPCIDGDNRQPGSAYNPSCKDKINHHLHHGKKDFDGPAPDERGLFLSGRDLQRRGGSRDGCARIFAFSGARGGVRAGGFREPAAERGACVTIRRAGRMARSRVELGTTDGRASASARCACATRNVDRWAGGAATDRGWVVLIGGVAVSRRRDDLRAMLFSLVPDRERIAGNPTKALMPAQEPAGRF